PGEARELGRRLHDRAHLADHPGKLVRGCSEQAARASRGTDEAEQAPDRRRLSRPVRTEEAEDAAFRHREVEPVEGDRRAAPEPAVFLAAPTGLVEGLA